MIWTSEQLAVIHHETGHAKVSAVAGSGKTATLIERIARLMDSGTSAIKIQALMFNASASETFGVRLRERLPNHNGPLPSVKTFHAVGLDICKKLEKARCLPQFELESRDWIIAKMASSAIERVTDNKPSSDVVEAFVNFISIVKSDIISASDKLPEIAEISGKEPPEYFVDAFDCFEDLRRQARLRFFPDLIRDPVLLLMNDPELSATMSAGLQQLMVDEFQDTDEVQSALITILAGETASVMAVGDVDQCIYEWRGANPMILESLFDADFPDCQTYNLSYTFRYGHAVSLIANHVKRHNGLRNRALCLSHESTPATETVLKVQTPHGQEIVDEILRWTSLGRNLNEVAILVRMYAMSAPAEIGLLTAGIPYRLDGKASVTDRPECQMVVGYLRAAVGDFYRHASDGTKPSEFLHAMLSVPPLPLNTDQAKTLAGAIAGTDIAPLTVAGRVVKNLQLTEWATAKVLARVEVIQNAMTIGGDPDALFFLKQVYETLDVQRAIERLSVQKDVGRDKTALLDTLLDQVEGMSNFSAASHFDRLMRVSTKQRNYLSEDPKADAVAITSIHKAKGLEFPLVLIPSLQDGLFPADRAESIQRIEAERRLFYVAATRVKERLVLLHPLDTDFNDYDAAGVGSVPDGGHSVASRFLYEGSVQLSVKTAAAIVEADSCTSVAGADLSLANEYVAAIGAQVDFNQVAFTPLAGRLVCGPNTPFKAKVNMKVEHQEHGQGVIKEIHPRAGTHSMVVQMSNGKQRIFVAHIAELLHIG